MERPSLTNQNQSQAPGDHHHLFLVNTAIPTEQSMTQEPEDDDNGKQEHDNFPVSDPEVLGLGV